MIAAVYCRKDGIADEERGVQRRLDHATAYAQRKGWHVDPAHLYSNDGVSGAEFSTRPGFLRPMNALKP